MTNQKVFVGSAEEMARVQVLKHNPLPANLKSVFVDFDALYSPKTVSIQNTMYGKNMLRVGAVKKQTKRTKKQFK